MSLELVKLRGEEVSLPSLLRWRQRLWSILVLSVVLVFVIGLASSIGTAQIPFTTTLQVLLSRLPFLDIHAGWPASTETIILDIRLPRIILGGIVGAALAVAGATYQGIFRNPLADPYIIGVAQGAALGATVGFLLPFLGQVAGFGLIPVLAFIGALVVVSAVYLFARVGKTLPVTTLVLAGVALGAFCASITSYLMIRSEGKLHGIVSWLLGGLSLSSWDQVAVVAPYIIAGIILVCLLGRALNVMQLDEEQAQQLGINVERVKLVLLAAASLITAAAVSVSGTIGFVGIIVAHAVRLIWGPDYRFLVPLSAVCGAIFLILADTLSRIVLMPTEVPVGVVTAFLGAPFFLYLLRREKRSVF